MLKNLTTCLEAVGYVNPMQKVYNLTKELDYLPLVAALLTLNCLNQLTYDAFIYSFVKSNKDSIVDGPHFIVGLVTLFKQYHPNQFKKYLLYLSHYFKNSVFNASLGQQVSKTLPPDAHITLCFLEELIRFEGSSREVIQQTLGTYIFDFYKI